MRPSASLRYVRACTTEAQICGFLAAFSHWSAVPSTPGFKSFAESLCVVWWVGGYISLWYRESGGVIGAREGQEVPFWVLMRVRSCAGTFVYPRSIVSNLQTERGNFLFVGWLFSYLLNMKYIHMSHKWSQERWSSGSGFNPNVLVKYLMSLFDVAVLVCSWWSYCTEIFFFLMGNIIMWYDLCWQWEKWTRWDLRHICDLEIIM
jgi:hypothetical protein